MPVHSVLADELVRQIPLLRRFARALTGSQEIGDALVARTIERIARSAADLEVCRTTRIGLYRTFARVWQSSRPPSFAKRMSSAPVGTDVGCRLAAIAPLPRTAFLLVAMEEFTPSEAAQILECPLEEISRLLEIAGEEIARQLATTVLIIEDEPLISLDLAELAESLGHEVVGIARTQEEAVRLASTGSPGLVLADVQLADGSSGISAVNELLQRISIPVIFITAYPERLLTGARPEPTFLVSKPYSADLLKAMISQAVFFASNAKPATLVA